jgi:hypothetical protein
MLTHYRYHSFILLKKKMQAKGRTGRNPAQVYGELMYDHENRAYTIRLDCHNNPEFWMSLTVPDEALEVAKTSGSALYGVGVTFGEEKKTEEEE